MPMRGELASPAARQPPSAAGSDRDAWAVLSFCLAGLLISIYFTFSSCPLDQLPMLIERANWG